MNLKLFRIQRTQTETIGNYVLNGKIIALCLELPWRDNQTDISCIPCDAYEVIKDTRIHNKRTENIFRILNVPDRDGVLIHVANVPSQLKGCQAPGLSLGEIDNESGVLASAAAMHKMYDLLPDKFTLEIKDIT